MSIIDKIAQKTKVSTCLGETVTIVQLPMAALGKMESLSREAKDVDQLMANIDMVVLCVTRGVKELSGAEDMVKNASPEAFQALANLASEVLDFSGLTPQDTDSPKRSAKAK